MSDESFVFLEPGLLRDDDLVLRLMRADQANPAKGYVPAYHFEMLVNGQPAGFISFRAEQTALLTFVGGYLGYEVHESFRGHRYAERACRLLLPFIKKHGFTELWNTCSPTNGASRRTLENLGSEMVEVVDVPSDHEMYQRGEYQKCRYRLVLS